MDKTAMLWMNREYGYLLTYEEMVEEGLNLYDLDDTNALTYDEYYECTGDPVPDDWYDDGGADEVDDYDESESYNYEEGFDPYMGCYTGDC